MPIYAYRCSSCGHQKDVLQRLSDAPLTDCPACGASTFAKQLTAAGFQLKGSGWYATDFRNSGGASKPSSGGETSSADKAADKPADKGGDAAPSADKGTAASAATPCGGSCACH